MPKLAVVSDSHLSIANPDGDSNWNAVIEHLESNRPDLVIHAGDISADGTDVRSDLEHARAQLDRIPVAWRAVPGNHDLGRPEAEWAITRRRRTRYEEVFGDRFWAADLDRFRLLGLDTEALVSGHPDDEEAWAWTAEQLTDSRPIVMIVHRPLGPVSDAEDDVDRRYVYEPHRSRLVDLLRGSSVVAVISGHCHQWRREQVDGRWWLWAPSCWAVVSDELQPLIGQKEVGLVEVELDQLDQARLVQPLGIERHITGGAKRAVHSAG